jgi:excisionase family DNA binding protein
MSGRPGRPRADDAKKGLTSGEVAKQLNCSRSNVDRLRKCGRLPAREDGAGKFRFQPRDVAALGKELGRPVRTSGAVAQRVYGYFLTPGFKGTPEQLGRIVHETGEDPDQVLLLWRKFKLGAGSPAEDQAEREIERLASEYDEQIKAMDEALVRKRRSVFIAAEDENARGPSSRT